MLLCLVACYENTEKSPETIDTTGNHTPTEGQSSTENCENKQGEDADEMRVLTLEKALHTYYEWADDYDRALVRSEHSCVMLGQTDADAYPQMAEVLN